MATLITNRALILTVLILCLSQFPALANIDGKQNIEANATILAEIKRLEDADAKAFADKDYKAGLVISDKLVAMVVQHLGKQSQKYAGVINDRATILEELDRKEEALELYRQSWELYTKLLGEGHSDSLLSLDNYAELLAKLNRHAAASELQEKSLELKRELLKPRDPELLFSIDKYASTLYNLGQYSDAKSLYAEALQFHRDLYGEKDPRTLRALNDYAITLDQLGELEEAEKLSLETLTLKREVLGLKHPDTLGSFNNYISVIFKRGRYDDAAKLFGEALALFEDVLGEKHPSTLYLLGNYATALQHAGQVQEAVPLNKKAMNLYRDILGPEHPQTINGINNYALSLQKTGASEEAAKLFENALDLRRKILGDRHPDTLASMINYATMLENMGQIDRSLVLHETVTEQVTEILGDQHPMTLMSFANYSKALNEVGRSIDAEPIALRVLDLRRQQLGNEHPDTMASISNYAAILSSQRRWQEAEKPSAEAYRLASRQLQETHPFKLLALNNYAGVLYELGKYEQAAKLHSEVYGALLEKLGEEHPNTLKSMSNYALALQNLGDLKRSEKLQRKSLKLRTKVLGETNPERINSLNNYAWLLQELGRTSEAIKLLQEAVALNQTLGDRNPHRFDLIANLIVMQLEAPGQAAYALDSARHLIALNRDSIAATGFAAVDQAQLARNEDRQNGASILFADAAWARGPGLEKSDASQKLPPFEPDEIANLEREAFDALQGAMTGSTSRAIARAGARKAAARISAELGQMALRRQTLSDEWIATDKALVSALSDNDDQAKLKRKNLTARREALSTEISKIEEQLRQSAPEYFALVRPETLTLEEAQSILGADEAVLLLVSGPIGTHVLAVTKSGLQWHRANITQDEMADVVANLRNALDQTVDPFYGEYNRLFDRETAYSLYQKLIAPIEAELEGKSHLFVAATGALTSLPLSMLVTTSPNGADDDPQVLRETSWLADKFALVQIPSLQALKLLRIQSDAITDQNKTAPRPFDGFGDPILAPLDDDIPIENRGYDRLFAGTRNADGTGVIDINKLKALPRLPGTATELKKLRRSLNAPEGAIRLQEQATEKAVRSADLSNSRVVAFATHGLLAGEISGAVEPGLVFTPPETSTEADDGYLTSSEISSLNINADWVILSACNTASGDSAGAPGLSGLARSFFYAGAKNLLVSHWPVRDDVASIITVDTIDRQKEAGISRAQAFQRAMKNVRDDKSDESKAHPAAWAPFILVGDR
ncbi:MAG: CHAT domain-containing protein [Parasphingorhabdus sp.]